jgi:NADH-quinone oxidoreductase subunit H
VVLLLLIGAAFLIPDQQPEDDEDTEPPVVSDYPVPPFDLAVPKSPPPRRRSVTRADEGEQKEPVAAGSEKGDR